VPPRINSDETDELFTLNINNPLTFIGSASGGGTDAQRKDVAPFRKQLSGKNGRLPLHSTRLRRYSLNLAHVSVVHAGHLPVGPGNRDRIPTRFGDDAAISGIASPINAGAFLEALRFINCH
jgi:hypothetical protein